MTTVSTVDLLETLAEPTRLRILNCMTAAPLFVSDLSEILGVPEATVTHQMHVLRDRGVVREVPLPPHVLYTLSPLPAPGDQLLRTLLDLVQGDPGTRADWAAAARRSRDAVRVRVRRAVVNAP